MKFSKEMVYTFQWRSSDKRNYVSSIWRNGIYCPAITEQRSNQLSYKLRAVACWSSSTIGSILARGPMQGISENQNVISSNPVCTIMHKIKTRKLKIFYFTAKDSWKMKVSIFNKSCVKRCVQRYSNFLRCTQLTI